MRDPGADDDSDRPAVPWLRRGRGGRGGEDAHLGDAEGPGWRGRLHPGQGELHTALLSAGDALRGQSGVGQPLHHQVPGPEDLHTHHGSSQLQDRPAIRLPAGQLESPGLEL